MSKKLVVKQIDEQIKSIKENRTLFEVPKGGWLKTVRNALGMTTQQLADRLGMNRSRVVRIERDEVLLNLTLKTLGNVAEAMECELYYAIVPKTSISETLRSRAELTAREILEDVDHTMQLEDQAVTQEALKEQFDELVEELMKKNPKHLWEK